MKSLTQQQLKSLSETFLLGQRAMQLGAFDQAEKHFLGALKINPNMIEAQASLAFVYAASKQHVKASAQLKLLLKHNPNHAQTHYNLANSLYEQKLYDEAIKHYQAAIKLEPKFVEAHIHCGIAHRMKKDNDAAIACLQLALGLDKANARAFYVLGSIYIEMEDYNRALHCLECATGLAPKQAEYQVSFAKTLEKANLDFEAGLIYHQACEIDPNYAYGFILYGKYLLEHYRYDEALECAKRAKQLTPEDLSINDQLGIIYSGMNDTEAALSQFNSALQIEPNRISSLLGIGKVYQDNGNIGEASEICRKLIALDANLPDGYLLKASLKKSKAEDGLFEQLTNLTKKQDLAIEFKISINFALGKILDDQSNYAEAFKYYSIGNALKNSTLNYCADADITRFSNIISTFNSNLINKSCAFGSNSKMPVIIIGMPRSGTTLTEQIISSHPDVIGAGEVVFWGRTPTALPLRLGTETPYPECITEISIEQAKDITTMYESTLHKIAGSGVHPKHITDKMPHNFLSLGLIAMLFPNAKIIHTKRDPIDTCLSIFFQTFNDAHPYAFDLSNLGFHYKQYERIMKHWHEVLPGRIMDINYEDTIADPEFWSRKLIEHIGLEWDDACLAPHKLERSVKTASHWQVRQPIYKTSVQRWKNYEEFLGPLIEALKD